MKIGLLLTKPRLEEQLLIKEFKKVSVTVVNIFEQQLKLDLSLAKKPNLKLVFNRALSAYKSELALKYFESLGIKTINSYQATSVCNNKILTTVELFKNKIPTLKTMVAFDKNMALEIIEKLGFPVVFKPVIGSWGKLAAKINDWEAAQAIIEHKLALNSLHHAALYIQEYIAKPGRDIRVLVIGHQPVWAMYRNSCNWITNVAQGAKATNCPLTREIKAICTKTTQVLGVEIAGVDLVETKNGLKVLEVNAGVEFHGLMKVAKINIPKLIVKYILKKAYEN